MPATEGGIVEATRGGGIGTREEEAAALARRAGDAYRQAMRSYQAVARLTPTDASAQFQLAQTAQVAGENAVALAAYKAYVRLQPDSPTAPAVRQIIAELSVHK